MSFDANTEEHILQELKRVYALNVELLENLRATIFWIHDYSQKTGTRIPNIETLSRLMRETTRLGEEVGSPLVPCHRFIKPLERIQSLTEDGLPPDKLPMHQGGYPRSICRIKSGVFGRFLVAFHRSNHYPARVTFAGPDSRHK